jgi:hypothetical protein
MVDQISTFGVDGRNHGDTRRWLSLLTDLMLEREVAKCPVGRTNHFGERTADKEAPRGRGQLYWLHATNSSQII